MKDNFIKKFADKLKKKFMTGRGTGYESNVCIKVFNCDDEDFLLSDKDRKRKINRKKRAVNFFDDDKLLGMNSCQREQYLFEAVNKILQEDFFK